MLAALAPARPALRLADSPAPSARIVWDWSKPPPSLLAASAGGAAPLLEEEPESERRLTSQFGLRFRRARASTELAERLAARAKNRAGSRVGGTPRPNGQCTRCRDADKFLEANKSMAGRAEVKCPPPSALCQMCMEAAYAGFWGEEVTGVPMGGDKGYCSKYDTLGGGGVMTAEQAQPFKKMKTLCDAIAGTGEDTDRDEFLGMLYHKYGPHFGATAVLCRLQGCCYGEYDSRR